MTGRTGFDPTFLIELTGNDQAKMASIVRNFIDTAERCLRSINDPQRIHEWHGAALSIDASDIAKACEQNDIAAINAAYQEFLDSEWVRALLLR